MLPSDLRITGMASGLDTQSIVQKLMAIEQVPLDKIMQNKQWTQWQQSAYRDVNTQLLDFRNAFQNLRLQSSFQVNNIQSTDTSKITATQSGIPSQSNYAITAATLYQAATPASVKFAKITKLADTSTQFGTGNGFSFTINNQAITLNDTDNIQTAISKINLASAQSHVTASYSAGDQAIIFTSNPGYTDINISGTNNSPNVLNISDGTVGLAPINSNNSTYTAPGTTAVSATAGQTGTITINGTQLTLTSNTFTFDGVQFTLNNNISSQVNVTKSTDTDTIFNNIKTFVDKYNDVIQKLNEKIDETKNRDYPPLTDAQRQAMSDTQITQWETQAKQGVLSNDSIISTMLTNLRKAVYTTVNDPSVNSNFNSLAKIGITTSSDYRDNGKLIIDETKLKSVLQTNASDVQKLFANSFNTSNPSDTTLNNSSKYNNSGVAWRMYDQVNNTIQQLITKAGDPTLPSIGGSLLDKSLQDINKQITTWQATLQQKENQYNAQFSAMEQAIQKMNSQSGWISQQLGTGKTSGN